MVRRLRFYFFWKSRLFSHIQRLAQGEEAMKTTKIQDTFYPPVLHWSRRLHLAMLISFVVFLKYKILFSSFA